MRIAVIGDALLDVTIAPGGPIRWAADSPAAVRVGPGGQGANVAVRLARGGAAVTLACGLGDDASGRLLREALESDGVALDVVPVPATGAVAILLDERGERTMLSQRAPFLADVDAADLEGNDVLVISGYVVTEAGATDVLGRLARSAATRTLLGCSLLQGGEVEWLLAARTLQPHLVIVSADEARALIGDEGSDRLAAALAEQIGGLAIVTTGAGASAAGAGLDLDVSVDRLNRPTVDTTGAGDAFVAALVAELARRRWAWPPTAEALRSAMAAGLSMAREVVGVVGAQGQLPSERIARAGTGS